MRNWHRSIIAKVMLIITAIATSAVAALSFVLLMGFSSTLSMSMNDLFQEVKAFEDTDGFENLLYSATMDVLNGVQIKEQLETDGKYNPDQLVDVMEYYDSQTITGKNESGLAYTVEELGTWSQKDGNRELEEIVVCKKTDNTYHYYYMNEFEALLENGSLKLEMDDESYRQLIKELEMGYYTSYSNGSFTLQDENGQTVYKTCWTFDGDRFGESYAPDGAANLLEVANEFPELNGHLSEMYGALRRAISDFEQKRTVYQAGFDNWTEGNTNFTYLFVDEDAKRVYTNNSHFQDYKEVEKNIQTLAESGKYVLVYPKLKDFQSNIDTSAGLWKENVESFHTLGDHYLAMAAVDTAYPIQDIFQSMAKNYNRQIPHIKWSGISLVLSIPLLLISIVWLTLIAGRSAGDEKGTLRLNLFDYWKTEAAAVLVIGIWILLTAFIINSWHGIGYTVDYTGNETSWYPNYHERLYYAFDVMPEDVFVILFYTIATMVLFLIGYLSLVRRIKGGTLWKNSLLRMLWHALRKVGGFIKQFWRNRGVTVKAIALFAVFALVHWLAIISGGHPLFWVLALVIELVAAYGIIRSAMEKERLKKGIEEIASGSVGYQIPLSELKGDYYEMAEKINNIGNGLQYAVEKSVKSERLKTDLITNVSHDIKTPLTSIINYVDLLKRENFEDPKVQGYLEILDAKSQRLKTLTEDVVEASKVSSGNITLECMDVNLVEMLNQTIGEFSEKMDAKQLRVVATLPEEPATVHVDGRRVWRILENIFNNAAKYAMPGTRVYADLKVEKESVLFSLKNVSEQPLNFSSDELTERFIRGDVSRNTEGSGLGLSIAKSLTEMQKGTFELYLDGDLFKVTICFPRVIV
ncbi:MAG: HAMP domain-containing histidine kinase [Ruminococcus sp.]|nr:HAMP domain-containing histidine kinase [Ruminococcus sp.]